MDGAWEGVAGWIIAAGAVVAALGVIWQKFAGPFIARPIGKVIREEIGHVVRSELRAEASELVEEIVTVTQVEMLQRIGSIESELRTNGGKSLKDAIHRLERSMTELHRKFDQEGDQ